VIRLSGEQESREQEILTNGPDATEHRDWEVDHQGNDERFETARSERQGLPHGRLGKRLWTRANEKAGRRQNRHNRAA
jgi:hypothetical protein